MTEAPSQTLAFSEAELAEVARLKGLYPHPKAAIMPVLWMAQKKWEWLSEDVIRCVAQVMDLPYAHVMGVASFYTMYFKKPMGRNHIQVCTNVSCMLKGGEGLLAQVKERLGVGNNQATEDGKFSIEEVECMGACGGAPMVAVNETFHENVTAEQLNTLIEGCR
jgi:NADH-quinone oxidoreductase E subunit